MAELHALQRKAAEMCVEMEGEKPGRQIAIATYYLLTTVKTTLEVVLDPEGDLDTAPILLNAATNDLKELLDEQRND